MASHNSFTSRHNRLSHKNDRYRIIHLVISNPVIVLNDVPLLDKKNYQKVASVFALIDP